MDSIWVYGGWFNLRIRDMCKLYAMWKIGHTGLVIWDETKLDSFFKGDRSTPGININTPVDEKHICQHEPMWRLVDWGFKVPQLKKYYSMRYIKFAEPYLDITEDEVSAFVAAWFAMYENFMHEFFLNWRHQYEPMRIIAARFNHMTRFSAPNL